MLFEEYMSKVYLAANSRKQVLDSDFEAIYNFTQKLDHKGKYLKRFRDTIKYDKGKSSIQVLASDATKLDSLNPIFIFSLCDILKKSNKYLALTAI